MSKEEDDSSPDRSGVGAMSRPPAPVQGIRPPQALSLGPNIVQEWKLSRQKWTNYAVITNLSTQDRAYQVALLLHTLGDDALRILIVLRHKILTFELHMYPTCRLDKNLRHFMGAIRSIFDNLMQETFPGKTFPIWGYQRSTY